MNVDIMSGALHASGSDEGDVIPGQNFPGGVTGPKLLLAPFITAILRQSGQAP